MGVRFRPADLAVTKQDSPDPVFVGNSLTYTIPVTNNGPFPATGVTLIDTLPAGVTFVSSNSSQGSCTETGGVVTCILGNLANGASATVEIVVTPTANGTITNTASVSGNELDPNPANNTDTETTTVNPTTPAIELAQAIISPGTLSCLTGAALSANDPRQSEVFITPLQGFPTNGNSFAILSSGVAADAPGNSAVICSTCFSSSPGPVGFDTVTLNLTFQLPANPGNLTFNWKFGTEEFPSTIFNDFFNVLINGIPIPDFPVTVNNTVLAPPNPNDVCYDFITPTIQTATFDLTPFAGQMITVTFQVSDVRDCAVDSAAFIDNLQIEGCEL